jgi:hypothetical protein
VTQLRPLSIGEVLDVAFKLYFRNWAKLVALVALIIVPANIINGLILSSAADFAFKGTLYGSHNSSLTGSSIVIGVVTIIGAALSGAVAFRATTEAYMGRVPSAGESVRFALRRLLSVLWIYLLAGLGILAGFILLIIPGIYLAVSWCVILPVVMVEGVKGRKALGRSLSLIDTRWWQTFGILIVLIVIVDLVPSVIGGLISSAIAGSSSSIATIVVVRQIIDTIVRIIAVPALVAGLTVLYFDLRVRKEGFDVELMLDQLGFTPPVAPPIMPTEPGGVPAPPAAPAAPAAPPAYVPPPTPEPPPPPPPPPAPGFSPPVAPDIGKDIGLPGSSDIGLPEDPPPRGR